MEHSREIGQWVDPYIPKVSLRVKKNAEIFLNLLHYFNKKIMF